MTKQDRQVFEGVDSRQRARQADIDRGIAKQSQIHDDVDILIELVQTLNNTITRLEKMKR